MLYLLLMGLVYNMNLKGTLKECKVKACLIDSERWNRYNKK